MKKIIFSFLSVIFSFGVFAQDNLQSEIKPVIAEGNNIYKVEMANWTGAKVFPEKYKGKEKVAGFISYTESDKTKSVFYSKGEKIKVIGTLIYDENFDEKNVQVDLSVRDMTATETELYKLQTNALKTTEDATFFTVPANAKLRVIPVVSNGERKVYVIAESERPGIVIFGNDFMLNYDAKLNLTHKKSLHKNTALVNYDPEGGRLNNKTSTHTHLSESGEMLTPTDVGILLLYEKMTKWNQHTFISENYIFFWNYTTHDIMVMPKKSPNK